MRTSIRTVAPSPWDLPLDDGARFLTNDRLIGSDDPVVHGVTLDTYRVAGCSVTLATSNAVTMPGATNATPRLVTILNRRTASAGQAQAVFEALPRRRSKAMPAKARPISAMGAGSGTLPPPPPPLSGIR